jgi:hypothetical protein
VVLDIGGDVGALVVHTPASMCGLEIALGRRGASTEFVHTEVRERRLPEGHVHAAVFIAVPMGEYTLLHAPLGLPRDVEIESGHVTELHW